VDALRQQINGTLLSSDCGFNVAPVLRHYESGPPKKHGFARRRRACSGCEDV
jgi:hypothetical protein